MKRIIVFTVFILLTTTVSAETIKLKSGEVIEGEIVERTEEYIKVDFEDVELTYYFDEIESVDGDEMGDFLSPKAIEGKKKDASRKPMETSTVSLERIEDVNGEIPEREKEIFREKLKNVSDLISRPVRGLPPADLEEVDNVTKELRHFSEEFPNSKLADDAQYLYVMLPFTGATYSGNIEGGRRIIEMMEEVIAQYPSGEIEDFWREEFYDAMAGNAGKMFWYYIPYKYVLPGMNGELVMMEREYEEAIKEYLILKDNLDFSIRKAHFEDTVYIQLWIAYKKLGRIEEANAILIEMRTKFSDNKSLVQTVDKLIEQENSEGNIIKIP